MKSALVLLLAAAIALLGGGCSTPSLNRLATPETIVTDPDLVGRWVDKEDNDTTYVVTESADKTYRLDCIPKDSKKHSLEFEFQIVRLGETRYIDMTVTRAAHDEIG